MNPVDAKAGILKAWFERAPGQRLEADISVFYDELVRARSPFLSFEQSHDRYQRVRAWLLPHVTPE